MSMHEGSKFQEQREVSPFVAAGYLAPKRDPVAEVQEAVNVMDIETLTLLMKYGRARLVTLLGELEGKAARARAELDGL